MEIINVGIWMKKKRQVLLVCLCGLRVWRLVMVAKLRILGRSIENFLQIDGDKLWRKFIPYSNWWVKKRFLNSCITHSNRWSILFDYTTMRKHTKFNFTNIQINSIPTTPLKDRMEHIIHILTLGTPNLFGLLLNEYEWRKSR